MPALTSHWRFFTAAICLALGLIVQGAEADDRPTFQTVGEILHLPKSVIEKSLPAHLTGVVTSAEAQWGERIFIADESGGILVLGPHPAEFAPGDLVEVEGTINKGPFSPVVVAAKTHKIGVRPLPNPKPVSVGELFTGGDEGQWVEITGWVRSVWRITPSLVGVNLVSGGSRLSIRVSGAVRLSLDDLLGARVRVVGVASVVRTREITRQVLEVRLFAASPENFIVEERDSSAPLAEPPLSYLAAFQFRPGSSPGQRVRVEGTVTYQDGNILFLTDGVSGLAVRTAQPETTRPGERVEAIGFPDIERYLPVLSDAVLIPKDDAAIQLRPIASTAGSLRSGLQHANFVQVTGELVDRMLRAAPTLGGELAAAPVVVLSLKTEDGIFEAEIAGAGAPDLLAKLEAGSLLELDGICLSQPDASGGATGFKLLVPSEKLIRVLRPAPFFNAKRLLLTLCGTLAILLHLAGWAVILTRRNAALAAEVRERSAINHERSRLARDLHDSLEQSLVGIDLQIASADLSANDNPTETREHLAAARTLVKHSHGELRQSIWNLRSPRSESFDLADALRRMADAMANGSGVSVSVEKSGAPSEPPAVLVEENLFRIGQEALTNAFKHSRAANIAIAIRYDGTQTELIVSDDGIGLATNGGGAAAAGHFGLLGMRERAQRVGADLRLEQRTPHGCTVRVFVDHTSRAA